jgi:hypothetical protein
MRKPIIVTSLILSAGLLLAGCDLTSLKGASSNETATSGTESSVTDGSAALALLKTPALASEVASSALLLRPGSSALSGVALSAHHPWGGDASSSGSGTEKTPVPGPITIDPNDPSATLASFDALAVGDYSLKEEAVASDRADYANEEILTYVLPDGTSEQIALYFGAVAATSSSSEETSSAAPIEERNNPFDSGYDSILHGYGYGSGACDGMLLGGYRFLDLTGAKGNVTASYVRTIGVAVTPSFECAFVSEEIHAVTDAKTYDLASFALKPSEGSYLSVEQAYATNGSDTRSVYVYTAKDETSVARLLLQDTAEAMRLVYLTTGEKVAIDRFAKDGNTYYAIHLKKAGAMALTGLYEKVVATDADGNETVTYVKVDPKTVASIPAES